MPDQDPHHLSRRSFLVLGSGTILGALLQACHGGESAQVTVERTAAAVATAVVDDVEIVATVTPDVQVTATTDAGPIFGSATDTHVITGLCIRDGACVEVCPADCIVPGKPEEEWPWYYINPDDCIGCGACVPECPVQAIFPMEDVPPELEDAVEENYRFFYEGPGYGS